MRAIAPFLLVLTAAAGAAAAWSCPEGTSFDGRGLCVSPTHPAAQSVAAALHKGFEDGNLGALIAGVWQRGQPVAVGALGDSIPGLPASPDMKHRLGNVAAGFLTSLFLLLVEDGVVSLDDPVGKYLPNLGIPKADKITLQMLSRSTTGIEHFPGMDAFQQALYANPFRTWDPRELVAFGLSKPLLFEPGTAWHFSDTNLVILGLALESATGQKVQDMITARLIRPLGLNSTVSPWTPAIQEPVLHSFTPERGVWEEATFWNPQWIAWAGNMYSSMDDLRAWFEALAGGRVLKPESLRQLLYDTGLGISPVFYYGMGVGRWGDYMFTNPSLQGLRGAVGRNEAGGATVVLYNTLTQASNQDGHQATNIFVEVAKALGLPVPARS
ncbi:beta-lactamase/transpeptidase-like protein [Hyaloraphidium curvatum]|nr:beta-lactamase/transpeptidase-like protein [Hyaloraphidium curvatum]